MLGHYGCERKTRKLLAHSWTGSDGASNEDLYRDGNQVILG